jgi:transcriptional regulator with XRE-family HTH domain
VELPDRIKQRRRALGWSQAQLARVSEHSEMTISKWERGVLRPTLDSVQSLADALGVTAEWLAYGAGQPPSELEA